MLPHLSPHRLSGWSQPPCLQPECPPSRHAAPLSRASAAGRPACLPAEMAPIYEEVCAEVGHSSSAAALEEMRQHNAQRLAELEEKIADAGGRLCSAQCLSSRLRCISAVTRICVLRKNCVAAAGGWHGQRTDSRPDSICSSPRLAHARARTQRRSREWWTGWGTPGAARLQHLQPPRRPHPPQRPRAATPPTPPSRREECGRGGGAGRAAGQGRLPVLHRGPRRRGGGVCCGGGQDGGGGAQDGPGLLADPVGAGPRVARDSGCAGCWAAGCARQRVCRVLGHGVLCGGRRAGVLRRSHRRIGMRKGACVLAEAAESQTCQLLPQTRPCRPPASPPALLQPGAEPRRLAGSQGGAGEGSGAVRQGRRLGAQEQAQGGRVDLSGA